MVAETATSSSGYPHAPRGDFSPDPTLAAQILDDLSNPDLSLRDIAHQHHTTLEALTTWLAREDIDERVEHLENAVSRRTRFVAASFLPRAAQALATVIDQYNDESAHIPVNPSSLTALEQRRRSSETARRAAALLLRLANFTPGPRASCSRPRSHSASPASSNSPLHDPAPAPLSEPEEAAIRRLLASIGTGEIEISSDEDLATAIAAARQSARTPQPFTSPISDLEAPPPPSPSHRITVSPPSPSEPRPP